MVLKITQDKALGILGWRTCYSPKENKGLSILSAKNQGGRMCPKKASLGLPSLPDAWKKNEGTDTKPHVCNLLSNNTQ